MKDYVVGSYFYNIHEFILYLGCNLYCITLKNVCGLPWVLCNTAHCWDALDRYYMLSNDFMMISYKEEIKIKKREKELNIKGEKGKQSGWIDGKFHQTLPWPGFSRLTRVRFI